MSKKEKLIKRFLSNPRDFTFSELITLLNYLGYSLENGGATSGSRVKFVKNGSNDIKLHKPHAYKCLLLSTIHEIRDTLKKEGLL